MIKRVIRRKVEDIMKSERYSSFIMQSKKRKIKRGIRRRKMS